jgi:hypothetical protein
LFLKQKFTIKKKAILVKISKELSLVIGSTILCSILNLQDICLFLALFSILVCLRPKLPSASKNPANQLLLKFDSLFTDFFYYF